ncbi:hypothetical protein OROHE_003502 [Orobanche hederae]
MAAADESGHLGGTSQRTDGRRTLSGALELTHTLQCPQQNQSRGRLQEDLVIEQELDVVSPSNKKRKTTATTRKRRQSKLKSDGGIFLNVLKSSFDIQDLFSWR